MSDQITSYGGLYGTPNLNASTQCWPSQSPFEAPAFDKGSYVPLATSIATVVAVLAWVFA